MVAAAITTTVSPISVDADVVRDVQVAEPVPLLGELQPARGEVVADEQLDPDADLREHGEQRERARRDLVERQHPHDERRCEREDDQERDHGLT